MLSARLLLITLLGSLSLVSASPALYARSTPDDPEVKIIKKGSEKDSAGAAYFITNEPQGNWVVVAEISKKGHLEYRKAVATRGLGAHGKVTPSGPNALFSQNSVAVSHPKNVLAAVNSGSNTVSLFSIDPKDPLNIKQIGQPVASGGDFPISIAFGQGGNSACVLNGGYISGIRCFTIDQSAGLVPKSDTFRKLDLGQTTPATGPNNTPGHIAFSENFSHLIVSIKGTPGKPGYLAIWDVSSDGTISKDFKTMKAPSGGSLPTSLTVYKGKNAVVSADGGVGFDVFDISGVPGAKAGSEVTSSKSSSVSISGQKATGWSVFSEKTGHFYFTDSQSSTITEVKVDETKSLKGSVEKQYDQKLAAGFLDTRIGKVGDKEFLFVLSAGTSGIEVFEVEKKDLKRVQKGYCWDPVKNAGVTINANNVSGMNIYLK